MANPLWDLARQFSDEDWTLLERLNQVGAATVTDLAVRLRTMPAAISPPLNRFRETGLVEVSQIGRGHDAELYRVSDQGRKVLRLLHPV